MSAWNLIPVVLAVTSIALAVASIRVSRRARQLAERSIEELIRNRPALRDMRSPDLYAVVPGGLIDPLNPKAAAGALRDWEQKKAEVLQADAAAKRPPWVPRKP